MKSALGNAEDRRARDVQNLVVVDARVDGGPMFKRVRPRARGMAFLVKKRMSHIHVAVDSLYAMPEGRPPNNGGRQNSSSACTARHQQTAQHREFYGSKSSIPSAFAPAS